MTDYYELLREGQTAPDWPYPVRYDEEHSIDADILILGGGVAGCHAAITAAKKGLKVALVEKGAVKRSGSGGAGVDHWHRACTNPASKVSPEAMTVAINESMGNYENGIFDYINCKEAYDALCDCEEMGLKIRDTDDEFKGADFRDEESKLLFSYDYDNMHDIRVVGGAKVKPILYKELKRLGVAIFDRVMATSLLNEGGKQGSRIVGATGLNMRTGEFYVFKANATIMSMANVHRLWVFSTELKGSGSSTYDPNCVGDGHSMAWRAGAELTMMEKSIKNCGGFSWPEYGVGNPGNTWFACSIVDAKGKEIPWIDRDGKTLETVSERYKCAPGQDYLLPSQFFVVKEALYKYGGPKIIPDLAERIRKGEFTLPLYADLPSMPEHERRAIFGLMVGNEGKSLIPIYDTYTKAGFDPDKDLLQAPVMPPDGYKSGAWFFVPAPPQWRDCGFGSHGGLIVDWDLKTSIEGLYAAGQQIFIGFGHSGAATSGRYAGRNAAEYVSKSSGAVIDRNQVKKEKARVYAPVRQKDGIGWKELHGGIARIMQDYCGEFKNEESLMIGLKWLREIHECEAATVTAANPHELCRAVECLTRINVGELIMHSSLARKASTSIMDFKRLDYPEENPPEWNKFITMKLHNEDIVTGELPFNYWLQPPYKPSYEENYKIHCRC